MAVRDAGDVAVTRKKLYILGFHTDYGGSGH